MSAGPRASEHGAPRSRGVMDRSAATERRPPSLRPGTAAPPLDPKGYRALPEWPADFGTVTKVGVEGTVANGAGLGRFLCRAGVEVIEVLL